MSAPAPAGPAQRTVRRLIVYMLLFALVVVSAVGFSGLLGRLLAAGTTLATGDVAGLARSLAFTLIGGPLAAVLWWTVWRRLGEEPERGSVAWGLYLAGASTLAILLASTNLLGTAAALLGGQSLQWPLSLATGLVWAAVWLWHRWMWRHARNRPTELADVPTVLGSVLGLLIGVGGAVGALSALFAAALQEAAAVGKPWWITALQSLVWAAGGGLVWWWHWKHDAGQRLRTGPADVALIAVGVLGAGILTLGGAGVTLFVLLRLAFDRTATDIALEPPGPALAAAAVGALVWVYHRGIALGRAGPTRQAGKLVTSGVALVAAASGIGVIVNAALAMAATPLAGSGVRTLLLGGLSSFMVGGPVWWLAWRPRGRHPGDGAGGEGTAGEDTAAAGNRQNARRVYLVVVFGISAVAAAVTLLVIGFRLFEYVLGDVTGGSLVDRIRAPLGLLAATGLVSGYHFAVWRRDRPAPDAAGTARKHTIGHVILVTGTDPAPLRRVIEEATGAGVTVWRRADTALPGPDNDQQIAGRLAAVLEGLPAGRVLVMVGRDGRIEAVPLQG